MGVELPVGWGEDACVVCPARCGLRPGEFDVIDGPNEQARLDREAGHRVDGRTGAAVCVHPYRVGLAPGRYVSGDVAVPQVGVQPVPELALVLPPDVEDLDGWLVAVLRTAPAEQLFDAVGQAEAQALQRFAPGAVAEALRRVLSYELAHQG